MGRGLRGALARELRKRSVTERITLIPLPRRAARMTLDLAPALVVAVAVLVLLVEAEGGRGKTVAVHRCFVRQPCTGPDCAGPA